MSNNAADLLEQRFGTYVTRNELTSLAEVLAWSLNLELDRKDKKSRGTLINWFDTHSNVVFPYIDNHIRILDKNRNRIF